MSKKATEFQKKEMNKIFRGKMLFKSQHFDVETDGFYGAYWACAGGLRPLCEMGVQGCQKISEGMS